MAEYNPFHSKIKNIYLGDIDGLNITKKNNFCQFEKIEFSESLLDVYPQGGLLVRDLSDIMTYMNSNEWKYITIEYEDTPTVSYFITNYSYVNNAASSNEENLVIINFSNYLFALAQNTSVSEVLTAQYPQVYKIDEFFKDNLIPAINDIIPDPYTKIEFKNDDVSTSNYMVYRPINPLDNKEDISSENIVQYMYYISSLACEYTNELPRFLMWTGFDNSINLKYIPTDITDDTNYDANHDDRLYAVYEGDTPNITKQDKIYKKIYQFTSNPATQYYNRKYYYTRITPKILNTNSTNLEQEVLLFGHQYLDNGSKYDVEIITTDGVVNDLPFSQGISSFEYKNFYGYYIKHDVDNNFRDSSLLSMEYGVRDLYENRSFLSAGAPYPFIDNAEMWKNVYDLTPLDPNIGSQERDVRGQKTNLQKIYEIRDATKYKRIKSDLIKDIEKQNFILYVLCCVKPLEDEQEETFFACLTGWAPDSTNIKTGQHGENLIYRYTWKRLEIKLTDTNPTNFTYFSNPESMSRWDYSDEQSVANDINTWAINLNERTNLGSGDYGYYGPGWYAYNLIQSVFKNVTYRPIGNRIGDLTQTANFSSTSIRPVIVKMTKVPYIKLIKQALNYSSVVTSDETLQQLIENSKGKYVYYFEKENVTDGPCNTQTSGGQ